jgi:hypothetical protein
MNNLVLVSLAIMAFTTYCFGFHRFRLVKHALRQADPPEFFNRFALLFTDSQALLLFIFRAIHS